MLIIAAGLPATGKTTVSRILAHRLGAVHLRVDTIEQAMKRAGEHDAARGPAGYSVAYALAEDLLRQGFVVWAESVNPLAVTREAWRAVADAVGSDRIEVEFACSDPVEHEHRAGSRVSDIAGLELPGWDEIQRREYEPWDGDHLVVDTAGRSPEESARMLWTQLAPHFGARGSSPGPLSGSRAVQQESTVHSEFPPGESG